MPHLGMKMTTPLGGDPFPIGERTFGPSDTVVRLGPGNYRIACYGIIAGGGSGNLIGFCGGGGGGGGCAFVDVEVMAAADYALSIPGAPGTAQSGNPTIFGDDLCIAMPGAPGSDADLFSDGAGGSGGSGGTGDVVRTGGNGASGDGGNNFGGGAGSTAATEIDGVSGSGPDGGVAPLSDADSGGNGATGFDAAEIPGGGGSAAFVDGASGRAGKIIVARSS